MPNRTQCLFCGASLDARRFDFPGLLLLARRGGGSHAASAAGISLDQIDVMTCTFVSIFILFFDPFLIYLF